MTLLYAGYGSCSGSRISSGRGGIKVKEAIRRRRERMEEEKAAVEATKVEKEEQKVEEVGVVVDMVSGKQIVQS